MRARRFVVATSLTLAACSDPPTASTPSTPDPARLASKPSVGREILNGNGSAGLLIAVTALEFGEVATNTTSPQQTVTITNLSGAPIVMSGAGGAPTGPFAGSQDCQGRTLNQGDSCHVFYTFQPTATGAASGVSSGTWNGQTFSVSLHGTGVEKRLFVFDPWVLDFGPVQVGTTAPSQTVNITNVSGAPIVMSGAGGAPPSGKFGGAQSCQGLTIAPGASCTMTFAFAPTAPGVLTDASIGTWNGQPFNIALKGTGVSPVLRISPSSLDFGQVAIGTTAPAQTVTITNVGLASLVMSGAGGAPPTGKFGGSQSCQGLTLARGASCTMSFAFSPTATGDVTDASIGTWNGQAFNIALKGTGITGEPTTLFRITPSGLDFSDVRVGSTAPEQTVTITNITSSPIVMSGAGGAPPTGKFGGAQSCQGLTLAAGASCTMTFAFAPTDAGPLTDASIGNWNGQAFNIALKGNGVRPHLLVAPGGMDFGDVAIGATATAKTVSITNLDLTALVMSGAGGAPPSGKFGGSQSCQGLSIAPGASCTMSFAFQPTAAGELTDASIGTWNDVPFNIALKGTGIGPKLLVSPVGFDFGVIPVGTTSPLLATNVTNVGTFPIVMSGAGGAPASPFSGAQDCQGVTLDPGQTCHISFGFAPTATGSFTGTSSGTWNDQSFSIALQGIGQTATSFSGFVGPLAAFPNFNKATAGQSIPVKFSLGSDFGLNIFVAGSPASGPVTCGTSDEIVATEPTSTAGGSTLSYDPLTTLYTYQWKTKPAWAGTCRQLVMNTFDGRTIRANVQFK